MTKHQEKLLRVLIDDAGLYAEMAGKALEPLDLAIKLKDYDDAVEAVVRFVKGLTNKNIDKNVK